MTTTPPLHGDQKGKGPASLKTREALCVLAERVFLSANRSKYDLKSTSYQKKARFLVNFF